MLHSVLLLPLNYKRFGFICCLFLLSKSVQAIPETQLEAGFASQLTVYIRTQGVRGKLVTADKHVIHYQRFDQKCNDNAVIVVPGWSEPYLKYAEVIYDLRQHQYCVYTYDHRGQGLSSRNLSNSQIGDVVDFDSYVNDLQLFDEKIVRSRPHKKVYILSHSMGGLIAVLYAARNKHKISGLILSTPMLQIKTGAWPEKLAYSIVTVMTWLGLGKHYALGQGNWQEKPFSENDVTHSRIRYEMGNKLLRNQPSLIVAGVSNRWLKTSLEYTWKVPSIISSIKQNILLLQAGEEQFVINAAEDRFCQQVISCEKFTYQHSRHELLMESDTIRGDVMSRIIQFIQEKSD